MEKLLILDSGRGAKLQFVSGPYGADYMDYERTWNIWLEDVKRMMEPDCAKLEGAITGRALYDGRLDAKAALRLVGAV